MTAEIAYLRIHKAEPNGFIGFRDAAMGPATYRLHLHNVLRSIEKVFIESEVSVVVPLLISSILLVFQLNFRTERSERRNEHFIDKFLCFTFKDVAAKFMNSLSLHSDNFDILSEEQEREKERRKMQDYCLGFWRDDL